MGRPICTEPTRSLPAEKDKCPKHGGTKRVRFFDQTESAKAKGLAVTFTLEKESAISDKSKPGILKVGKVDDLPTMRVSVVAQTSGLVALAWDEGQKSFWLPSADVGQDEKTDKAAERALFNQAGISLDEVPGVLENVGIFRDPDGRATSVYSLSLDDPRHVHLRPKGRAGKDLSWARWLPIDTFIENVRGFHTGSSGEGTNHKFVPLHHGTLSAVETKFLTECLENARETVKRAGAYKGASTAWVSGTASAFMAQTALEAAESSPLGEETAEPFCGTYEQWLSTSILQRAQESERVVPSEAFLVEAGDMAVIRTNGDICDANLDAWQQILAAKCAQLGIDPKSLHQWNTGTADFISIFDGPTGESYRMARAAGLSPMPPIDVVAELPYDLMNDAHFASVMVGMYSQRPGFTLLAPPCTAYTAAMRFNRGKPKVMAKNREDRALQEKLMKRVNQIMRAAFTYGGEVMIENPRHSDYWKQAFIADFEESLPEGRVWRDVELKTCAERGRPILRRCVFGRRPWGQSPRIWS